MVSALLVKGAARSIATAQLHASRSLSTSVVARRDLIQEAYLRELKAYKPAAKSADSHKGSVREFHQPQAPKAPETPSSSSLSSELDAYASSEPDIVEAVKSVSAASEESAASAAAGGAKAFLEEARKDYPKEEAHH
ncbi:unnamed protein product [Parajaminaea phylloscopi]